MRALLMLALFVVMLVAPSRAQEAKELTAAEVMQKCGEAYDALQSYVCRAQVFSSTTTRKGEGATSRDEITTWDVSSKIQFLRPSRLRVDGNDEMSNFTFVGAPPKAWLSESYTNNGAYKEQDFGYANAMLTAISGSATRTVFALLTKVKTAYPLVTDPKARVAGRELVDGFDCYKVVANEDSSTETFWVDSKTFFLRRTLETQTEAQHAASSAFLAERTGDAGFFTGPHIISRTVNTTFAIESTNAKLDDALFSDPTQAQPKQ